MKSLILSLTVLTAAASLGADVIVTEDTKASAWNDRGADPLTKVFTANSKYGSEGGVTADTSMAQTFTVNEAYSAKSFHIRFRQGGEVGIAVYQVADANAATLTLGTQVFSASVTLPNVGTTTTFANLTLDNPLALAAGAYVFQISTAGAKGFEWRRTTTASGGDTYAGGRAYAIGATGGAGKSFDAGGSEFSFAVVTIPEPSASDSLGGTIAEVLLYEGAVSEQDAALIQDYLRNKYAIATPAPEPEPG